MKQSEAEHLKRHLLVKEIENTEIRDSLALERTLFANERTFLAYVRTAMGLVLGGFSMVQFFHHKVFVWVGGVFVPIGILVGLLGLKKYLEKRKAISEHKAAYTPTSQLHAQFAADQNHAEGNSSDNGSAQS
jgi:putative membrane protein